jgi:hypothetical protein
MGGKNMKKIILASFVVVLLFFTTVSIGFTAGAVQFQKQTQTEKIESAGMGTIKGTITNQEGRTIALVRIIAAGSPKDNATTYGYTLTKLIEGKGTYSMQVSAGRYLFVRAGKLPFYIGAWAGPVTVIEGEAVTLDLSITYIGPKINPVLFASGHTQNFQRLFKLF